MQLSRLSPFDHPAVFGRDECNPYYYFLARVVDALQAQIVLELGTCSGGSTSHLAAAGAKIVLSIDISQRSSAREALARFPNVELWERDTKAPALIVELRQVGPFDVLFIDTHHTPEQAGFELDTYGPLVHSDGLILLDDVRMDAVMSAWWDGLEHEKLDLPDLHWSGFGVVFPSIPD